MCSTCSNNAVQAWALGLLFGFVRDAKNVQRIVSEALN